MPGARIFLYILFYVCLKYSRAALQGQGCCSSSYLFIHFSTFQSDAGPSVLGRCRPLLFSAIRASAQWPANLELFLMALGRAMPFGFNSGKMESI